MHAFCKVQQSKLHEVWLKLIKPQRTVLLPKAESRSKGSVEKSIQPKPNVLKFYIFNIYLNGGPRIVFCFECFVNVHNINIQKVSATSTNDTYPGKYHLVCGPYS